MLTTDASAVLPHDLVEPYQPAVIYYDDSDRLEFVLTDSAVIYRWVSPFLSLMFDMEGRNCVGFCIEGLGRHLRTA